MSILDSIPQIVADATAGVARDITYHKPGEPTSDGWGGWTPGTPQDIACKGIVDDYSAVARSVAGIPANDRRIIIFAATLAHTPKPNETLTAEGRTWTIIAVNRDPAAATWEIQVR